MRAATHPEGQRAPEASRRGFLAAGTQDSEPSGSTGARGRRGAFRPATGASSAPPSLRALQMWAAQPSPTKGGPHGHTQGKGYSSATKGPAQGMLRAGGENPSPLTPGCSQPSTSCTVQTLSSEHDNSRGFQLGGPGPYSHPPYCCTDKQITTNPGLKQSQRQKPKT